MAWVKVQSEQLGGWEKAPTLPPQLWRCTSPECVKDVYSTDVRYSLKHPSMVRMVQVPCIVREESSCQPNSPESGRSSDISHCDTSTGTGGASTVYKVLGHSGTDRKVC